MEDEIKQYLANWHREMKNRNGKARIAPGDAYSLAYDAYKRGLFELYNEENSDMFDKEFFRIIKGDEAEASLGGIYRAGRMAGQAANICKICKI